MYIHVIALLKYCGNRNKTWEAARLNFTLYRDGRCSSEVITPLYALLRMKKQEVEKYLNLIYKLIRYAQTLMTCSYLIG